MTVRLFSELNFGDVFTFYLFGAGATVFIKHSHNTGKVLNHEIFNPDKLKEFHIFNANDTVTKISN